MRSSLKVAFSGSRNARIGSPVKPSTVLRADPRLLYTKPDIAPAFSGSAAYARTSWNT